MGCPDPGEGSPLIDVLADVESGVWVGAGPIIQHHYEELAIWLRARLSWLRPLPK